MDEWTDAEREEFGRRLQDARERCTPALTQTQVGDLFGASKQAVSSWEKGRNMPNAEQIARLADEYQVSVEWLLLGATAQPLSLELRQRLAAMDDESLRRVENSIRAQLDMPPLERHAAGSGGRGKHQLARAA